MLMQNRELFATAGGRRQGSLLIDPARSNYTSLRHNRHVTFTETSRRLQVVRRTQAHVRLDKFSTGAQLNPHSRADYRFTTNVVNVTHPLAVGLSIQLKRATHWVKTAARAKAPGMFEGSKLAGGLLSATAAQ